MFTYFFPHLHTPFPPFSPSLISLMVSVDVKHHVYFRLTTPSLQTRHHSLVVPVRHNDVTTGQQHQIGQQRIARVFARARVE